jgi:hypothetical protein
MTDENKLVFAHASKITTNKPVTSLGRTVPIEGTEGKYYSPVQGFFAGDPNHPSDGRFVDHGPLHALAEYCSKRAQELGTLVNMDYIGIARDEGLTLVLQPIYGSLCNDQRLKEILEQNGML